MGSRNGHVGPGLGFVIIGLWHLYNHLKMLARKGRAHYKNLPWFHHFELYFMILGSAIAVAMELFIGPHYHQPLDPSDLTIPTNHLHNFEHSSIELTVITYAVLALLLDRHVTPARHDLVQLVVAAVFGLQWLLFHLHSTDHTGVEGQYHWLLQLVIFVSLATTLMGIAAPRSFVVGFTRSLSVFFQGVWLVVMGIALWTPGFVAKGCFLKEEDGHKVVECEGDESLHRAKALVNLQFSWLFILLVIFGVLFYIIMMKNNNNNNIYDYEKPYKVKGVNYYCAVDDGRKGDIEVQKIDETTSFVHI